MDVAAYVKNVLSAYRNASSLVKRVQEKRSSPGVEVAPDEQLSELADSLALGPPVIDGQYKHELKRFGEAYACGDAQARDQMKDVLITLQMAVMSMQNVVLDDGPLDYPSLQSASDDSRVNAVVCLGQLSQRISAAVQAKAMLPYNGMPYPTGPEMMLSPSLQYSSSRSTKSSGSTPMTPDYATDRTAVNSFGHFEPKPLFAERTPSAYSASISDPSHRRMTNPRGDRQVSPPLLGASQLYASDSTQSRRPSSQALAPEDTAFLIVEGQKLSPQSSQAAMSADTASLISGKSYSVGHESPDMVRGASQQTDSSRDRYGPDDFGDMAYNRGGLDDPKLNYNSLYQNRDSFSSSGRQPSDPRPRHDTQSSEHSTLEHIAFLQSHARRPTIDDYRMTSPLSMTQPSHPPPPPPPLQHERTPSLHSSQSNDLSLPTRQRAPSTNSQDRDVHPAWRTTPYLDPGRPQDGPSSPTKPAHAAYQAKLLYYETQRTRKPLSSRAERPSISAPIPIHPEGPPQPQSSPSSSTFKSLMPSLRRKSPHSDTSTTSAPALGVHPVLPTSTPTFPLPPTTLPTTTNFSTLPLNLPTESNTLNFCRGAFKLQAGLSKKAFTLSNRPSGMTSTISYWQCSKCAFEGPVIMHTPPPPPGTSLKKAAKAEKIFDPRVRVCDGGGVRYKWVFLAKSHVSCKSVPEGEDGRRGEFGAFACLFCCAEGRARGWVGGGAAGPAAAAAPIFGNVGSFMEHLSEVHRREEGWPGVEMLGRGKCVVGRVAGPGEEWDVNFVPV